VFQNNPIKLANGGGSGGDIGDLPLGRSWTKLGTRLPVAKTDLGADFEISDIASFKSTMRFSLTWWTSRRGTCTQP